MILNQVNKKKAATNPVGVGEKKHACCVESLFNPNVHGKPILAMGNLPSGKRLHSC
jgi:hypothetical protein